MAYIHYGRIMVATRKKTKLFMSGNSQAVRIPREFQLEGGEVEIQRRGNTLVIRQKKQTWQPLTDSLTMFTDDFMGEGRQQPPIQKRKRPFA
ncbi:MAG: type II toxin-antitoxin system VapB family antitoxin [Nitrospira sp.]|nr:type II toxin-antitoxin system VapB family antitoxin [Nitrospira sp.]